MGAREITIVSRPENAAGEKGEFETEAGTEGAPDPWRVRVPARLVRGARMAVVISRLSAQAVGDLINREPSLLEFPIDRDEKVLHAGRFSVMRPFLTHP